MLPLIFLNKNCRIAVLLCVAVLFVGCTGSDDDDSDSSSTSDDATDDTVSDDDSTSDDTADDTASDDTDDDATDDTADDTSDDTADDSSDDTTDDTSDDTSADDDTTITGCVTPYDDMIITTDTVICPRTRPYVIQSGGDIGIIRIEGSDLTLSGYGVTFIGDKTDTAIVISQAERSNITIEGFTLLSFHEGVNASGKLSNITIKDMDIEWSSDLPINVFPSSDNLDGNTGIIFDNLIIANSHTGPTCTSCFNSVIRNSYFSNGRSDVVESSIILFGGGNNVIENNTIITYNGEIGCNAIWLVETDNNIIQNNYLELERRDGSHVHSSSNNIFRYNHFKAPYGLILLEPYAYKSDLDDLESRYGTPILHTSKSTIQSKDNLFYGNEFYDGFIDDRQGVDSVFCFEGIGNNYYDGAYYTGPSLSSGTCASED